MINNNYKQKLKRYFLFGASFLFLIVSVSCSPSLIGNSASTSGAAGGGDSGDAPTLVSQVRGTAR